MTPDTVWMESEEGTSLIKTPSDRFAPMKQLSWVIQKIENQLDQHAPNSRGEFWLENPPVMSDHTYEQLQREYAKHSWDLELVDSRDQRYLVVRWKHYSRWLDLAQGEHD